MLGTRPQIRQRGGFRLGLLAVSALLAFALFSAPAGAVDSSELEYRDAPPPEIERKAPQKKNASQNGGGGSGQSATRPGSDDGSDGEGKKDEDSGVAVGGKDDGRGGKGGDGQGAAGQKNGKANDKAPGSLEAAPASSDDDGSPLVPILIALAVLAAISIGVVAMRRRRDAEPGAPTSPEAG